MMKQNFLTKLLLLCLMVVGSVNAWGAVTPLDYQKITETTLVYTTTTNLAALGYAQDGKGSQTYNAVSSRGTAMDPTDESKFDYDIGSNGVYLKSAGSNKEVLLYVTNVTKLEVYGKCNSKSDRHFVITATPSDASGNVEVTGDELNSGATASGKTTVNLVSTKSYTISIHSNDADITLYALRLTAAASCDDVAAPTGLNCTAHTKNSLSFGWTAAENATTYTATLYANEECTSEVTSTSGISGTTVTFSTLSGSTTYYCKVQSNGDGETYCAEGGVTDAASGITDDKDFAVTAESNNDEWGSVAAEAGSLDEGEETQITATPKAGYKFVSWEVSGTGSTLSSTTANPTTLTMGTADATVTATFRELYTYKISYEPGTGEGIEGSMESGTKTEDVAFTLPSAVFSRDGYAQTGWATSDGGDKAYNLGGSYTTNAAQTFYPFWTAMDAQTDVTGAVTWDWSKYGTKEIKTENTSFYRSEILVANVSKFGFAAPAEAFGPADALVLNGDYIVRDSKYCQVTHAKFTTTVPGIIDVEFSNTGGDRPYRYLYVNGVQTEFKSNVSNKNTKATGIPVSAGDIDIYGVLDPEAEDPGAGVVNFLRIYNITFTPTVSVSVGEAGYATYCNSDYALDFTDKSIQAFIATNADGNEITMTQVNQIAKGEPVLLFSETGNDSQTILTIADDEVEKKSATENYFRQGDGTTGYVWADEDEGRIYVLNTTTKEPGFYKANNNKVATTKAYLSMPAGATARFGGLVFEDDTTTGIANVSGKIEDVRGDFYNLAGQRVAQPQKGLYIVNGKKAVIK